MPIPVVDHVEHIVWRDVAATRVHYKPRSEGGYTDSALYIDGCPYCEQEKADGNCFFPSHFAGTRCESGKHNHCTCDSCF